MQPNTISRDQHNISRKDISKNALKVLYRLHEGGFESYLVGGGVRDLLLQKSPKDFDIATNASPEEVQGLFKNCRLIGRRFRLAHVVFGRDIIEVATFRAAHTEGEGGATGDSGRITRDNVFGGTLADDAVRRDFTVNALYYNIDDFSVVDHFDGVAHLQQRKLIFIGDAHDRVIEDPVRALRAVRFSAKLDLQMDDDCIAAIEKHRHLLAEIPPARLFEEVLKLVQTGHGVASFRLLREHDLLQFLFPHADHRLKQGDERAESLILRALANTDARIAEELPVTPAFIYAVFLWPDVIATAEKHQADGLDPVPALHMAADEIVPLQLQATSLPKRFSVPMREIWVMQPRLKNTRGARATRMLSNPRFRAAYDFLCLRNDTGEDLQALCSAWESKQQTPQGQELLAEARSKAAARRRSRSPRDSRNSESRGKSGGQKGGQKGQASGDHTGGKSGGRAAGAAAKKVGSRSARKRVGKT